MDGSTQQFRQEGGNENDLSKDNSQNLRSRELPRKSPAGQGDTIEGLSWNLSQNQNEKRTSTKGGIQKRSDNNGERGKSSEDQFLVPAIIVHCITTTAWTLILLYATYHTYLAAEDMMEWQRDPDLYPGPFTKLLQRGRDTSDYEWAVFTEAFFSYVMYWYILYLVAVRAVHHFLPQHVQNLPTVSAAFTFVFLFRFIGIWPTTFLYLQTVMFWLLLRLKKKSIIWIATILTLIFLSSSWCRYLISIESGLPRYYFFITSAWTVARCISFCFDTWDRKENTGVPALASCVKYCFYFPLTINGPLILFDKYEKDILLRPPVAKTKKETIQDLYILLNRFARLFFWIIVTEFVIHYFYFRPLALTIPALHEINWWALCGIVYWVGQFFQLKYVVMYGIPSAMAEFEGLSMPPLPKCISYIHRYSVLWKDFDRGLYYFLVRYTYLPTLEFISKVDSKNKTNLEVRKLLASFASFVYIYIWHSTSFDVFIWAAFNFLGITIERIGSYIKRRIDSKFNIAPVVWDVLVEPLVTVPLAVMSVMNSAVFCGTLETAQVVFDRFFAESHYVFHFMYFFTHAGVALRTWPKWSPRIRAMFVKTLTKTKQETNTDPLKCLENSQNKSLKPD